MSHTTKKLDSHFLVPVFFWKKKETPSGEVSFLFQATQVPTIPQFLYQRTSNHRSTGSQLNVGAARATYQHFEKDGSTGILRNTVQFKTKQKSFKLFFFNYSYVFNHLKMSPISK